MAQVKREINDGDGGDLTVWADKVPGSFWLSPGTGDFPSMSVLSAWASSPDRLYTAAAVQQFLGVADYFLVAQAHAGQHSVVTFEKSAPRSRTRILIPDTCAALDVPAMDPFTVYRRLGLHF